MSGADPRGRAVVIVASTRAAAGEYEDRTGPVIAAWLAERGFAVDGPVVRADGPGVEAALAEAVAGGARVVLTTGGTGVTPTDRTPEATAPLLDLEIPGIVEEVRRVGVAHTPTAVLTRGHAGVAGGSFVMNLPGSPGGVRDGLAVLDGVLDHVLEQIRGSVHPATDAAADRGERA
ncbi:molybdenum cofactor synthesis domain-containing protein [Clavibacter sp. MX14-G9D]|uniref:MogA/MoaB family molybdenum cofactor biosynthesis protein n=1 Tax=Clavibacter sp. MX14-G9D TaxID=3064656 RepID=UPI00293ED8B0|nr:molybdenum cofactor synthesis domain-containing protein [Clavibacter sp. MX14-G9D]